MKPPLPRAYWETGYQVELRAGRVVVRIGEVVAAIGVPWAIITAWNPNSRLLSAEENANRHERLARQLGNYLTYPATGIADQGDWREEGLCVLSISETDAIGLAR